MIDWRKVMIAYGSAVLLLASVDYTYRRFMPVSHWVQYRSIELAGPATPGGAVTFLSRIDRYRTVNMRYNDSLFCDTGAGEFLLYSTQSEAFDNAPPRTAFFGAPWAYTEPVPTSGKCYLRSSPSIDLGYGITRHLPEMRTEPFTIGD